MSQEFTTASSDITLSCFLFCFLFLEEKPTAMMKHLSYRSNRSFVPSAEKCLAFLAFFLTKSEHISSCVLMCVCFGFINSIFFFSFFLKHQCESRFYLLSNYYCLSSNAKSVSRELETDMIISS